LRLLQPPSQKRAIAARLQWFPWAVSRAAKQPWLKSCILRSPKTTGGETGALTVAGQWRNFTAFPSILAIAVVKCTASCIRQPVCHGTDFHVINFYSRARLQSQKSQLKAAQFLALLDFWGNGTFCLSTS